MRTKGTTSFCYELCLYSLQSWDLLGYEHIMDITQENTKDFDAKDKKNDEDLNPSLKIKSTPLTSKIHHHQHKP